MSKLLELAELCESAVGPSRELDALIAVTFASWPNTLEAEQSVTDEGNWSIVEREPDGHKVDRFSPEPVTASLDAALTLLPEHEGIGWRITDGAGGPTAEVWCFDYDTGKELYSVGANPTTTPALALCAASLRARAAQ